MTVDFQNTLGLSNRPARARQASNRAPASSQPDQQAGGGEKAVWRV